MTDVLEQVTEERAAEEPVTGGRVDLNEDQVLGIASAQALVEAKQRAFEVAKQQANQILGGPANELRAANARYLDLCKSVLRVNGEQLPDDGVDYAVGHVPGKDGAPVAVAWELRDDHGESD